MMYKGIVIAVLLSAPCWTGSASAQSQGEGPKRPTIILVHGAFAGSSSWNKVISKLLGRGYNVIAAANPLRSVASDALYLSSLVKSVPGSVVLVGHSYGGEIITAAAVGAENVKALVYVAGTAPDVGESSASIGARFPGSTLDSALDTPVPLADGGKDLYIQPNKFRAQFAADIPIDEAAQMAATQRPITEAALSEPAGRPAWKEVPSWFIFGSLDKNIPRTAHAFMAQRAGARETIEVDGASHALMMSHPDKVTALIEQAAVSRLGP